MLTALLTVQRFHRVTSMRRSDIRGGVWDARSADDADNKQASEVPLSSLALEVIDAVPVVDDGDFVFSLNGRAAYSGWSKAKAQLDARMAELLGHEVEPWQHRDLKRTARSLMSRAGVSREVIERCLGHVIGGVEGVYDRHSYLDEKRDAFEMLDGLIRGIALGERQFSEDEEKALTRMGLEVTAGQEHGQA